MCSSTEIIARLVNDHELTLIKATTEIELHPNHFYGSEETTADVIALLRADGWNIWKARGESSLWRFVTVTAERVFDIVFERAVEAVTPIYTFDVLIEEEEGDA